MRTLFTVFFVMIISSVFSQDKTWTCIDEKGEEVFTIEAKYVREFSGGLAAIYQQVWDGSKWNQGYGFVNKKGEIVVPCIYKSVNPFEDSVTWVQDNDKKNILIDKKGNVITTKEYTKVGTFFEGNKGLCAVYVGDKMGFINREGKEAIPCKFFGASGFHDNRACVFLEGSQTETYGFIDRTGNFKIPTQFTQAGISSFQDGKCRVQKKGSKTFLIDTNGNEVFKTKYNSMQDMNMGLAAVSLGTSYDKWSYINMKDEIAIKGPFDLADAFSKEGLAVVQLNDKEGLIDTTGKYILEMKYKSVYNDYEEDGFYCGVYGDKDNPQSLEKSTKDYFLKDFKKLEMEVAFLQSANYSDRILYCTKDGLKGYLDRQGNVVIEARYSKANPFSEGVTWVKK